MLCVGVSLLFVRFYKYAVLCISILFVCSYKCVVCGCLLFVCGYKYVVCAFFISMFMRFYKYVVCV